MARRNESSFDSRMRHKCEIHQVKPLSRRCWKNVRGDDLTAFPRITVATVGAYCFARVWAIRHGARWLRRKSSVNNSRAPTFCVCYALLTGCLARFTHLDVYDLQIGYIMLAENGKLRVIDGWWNKSHTANQNLIFSISRECSRIGTRSSSERRRNILFNPPKLVVFSIRSDNEIEYWQTSINVVRDWSMFEIY